MTTATDSRAQAPTRGATRCADCTDELGAEFEWARRFFAAFRRKARDGWAHARQHPASSIVITVGGLAAAAVAVWAVGHVQLVERVREALGA